MTSDDLPPLEGVKYYFVVQKFCFTAIGVDALSARRTIVNGFLFWIPNIVQFILSQPLTLYSLQHLEDMSLVTDAMAPVWQVLMANMKMALFLWHKKEMKKLVRDLWLWNLEGMTKGKHITIVYKGVLIYVWFNFSYPG